MILRLLAVLALCVSLLPRDSAAASVLIGDDAPCTLHLRGEIAEGDFDQLTDFTGTSWDSPSRVDAAFATLCLDSPGGNLAEGVRIAGIIYDLGMSTRIGDGARCHSICAIIFMMGNQRSTDFYRASDGRTLHIGGDLAFHSPSLRIDKSRSYSGENLEQVYDLAIESALRIVQLAGSRKPFTSEQMIHPGLIGEMLATPAADLFHLTRIEQALAWDIRLDGLPDRLPQLAFQRQMVCDNSLTRGVIRASRIGYGFYTPSTMTEAIFGFAPIRGADRILDMDPPLENGATPVMSFRYLDLPSECQVRFKDDAVEVCGQAPKLNRTIGDCERGHLVQAPRETRFHPLSEFGALLRSTSAHDAIREAHCRLLSSQGTTLREGPCLQSVDLVADPERDRFRHRLDWQAGTATIVDIGLSDSRAPADLFLVDGVPAEPFGDAATCLRLPRTGQVLCVESR